MGTTKLLLDYDYDFLLIGILTSLPDYKLCWGMNKTLKISLSRKKDLEMSIGALQPDSSPTLEFDTPELNPRFAMFDYYNEVTHVRYSIIANKSKSAMLIREEQSVDFFLIVDGLYEDSHKERSIIDALKEQAGIITAYKIDPNQLKSKQNLIFE